MTAKEKAIELCDKFREFVDFTDDDFNTSLKHRTQRAKQCALIAIEQIETITKHYPPDYMLTVYWNEVKQEIVQIDLG